MGNLAMGPCTQCRQHKTMDRWTDLAAEALDWTAPTRASSRHQRSYPMAVKTFSSFGLELSAFGFALHHTF
jgi:hypothetical protein